MSTDAFPEKELVRLQLLVNTVKKCSNDIAVIVIANLKNHPSFKDDYKIHSLKTEFFADFEHEQIITALRDNGFYVIFHSSEMDFIQWYLAGGYNSINKRYKIIYGAASSGKGPGKKAFVPAFCTINNLAFVSSNAYVVSLCRHKYHFCSILEKHNISVARSFSYHNNSGWLLNKRPEIKSKIIAKPTYEAASIGINENSVFQYSDETDKNLFTLSKQFEQPITVQEFIQGYEVEIPVLVLQGNPIGIKPVGLSLNNTKYLDSKILTYDIVYEDKYDFYDFNEFDSLLNERLLSEAANAALIVGIEGYGRVDFRITKNGEFYIIDMSTYPHINMHSSFWHSLKSLGFEYKDLFSILVGLSSERYGWKMV